MGGEGEGVTPLAKCYARAVSKLLSQITRISDPTRSTAFSVLLKLKVPNARMLLFLYFSIATSTFISTLSTSISILYVFLF